MEFNPSPFPILIDYYDITSQKWHQYLEVRKYVFELVFKTI